VGRMGIPHYKIAFDGVAAKDDVYENLIRLEIVDDSTMAGSIMVRLSIALQEDGEWSYLKDDRFALFKRVTVSMGFGQGRDLPLFEGYLLQLAPHFDPQEELCYLEMRGMDATCLMNLEEKLTTWVGQSHSAIASQIFNDYGITPDVADAPTTHQQDGNTLLQRGTDLRFLKDLAARSGFECYVWVDDNGTVQGSFKPCDLTPSALPPLAVQFEGETNVQYLDVQVSGNPPLSFSGWHMNLEDRTVEKIDKSDYEQNLLGKESLIDVVKSKVEQLSIPVEGASRSYRGDTVFLDRSELDGALQGRQDRQGWFVRAKGIVNGEAYGAAIRSRKVIAVKGLGTRYSGNYLVSSVRHVIAEGEYEQHVELVRNGWGVAGNESFQGASR
jgi:phage protein D